MGCCQAHEGTQHSLSREYTLSRDSTLGSLGTRASTLSDMIAAGYHERTLSALDLHYSTKAYARAMAVQDALQRGHFLDNRACELEEYVLDLQQELGWKSLWSVPYVCIDLLLGSRYSPQPVFRTKLHFNRHLSLSYVLALLESPDIRARWDYNLQHMSVLYVAEENYYIRNSVIWTTFPVVISREFVERCQVREIDGELRLVAYSTDHPVPSNQDFPLKESTQRAVCLFSLLQLHKTSEGTELILTFQNENCADVEAESHSLFDWVDRLQREVELSPF